MFKGATKAPPTRQPKPRWGVDLPEAVLAVRWTPAQGEHGEVDTPMLLFCHHVVGLEHARPCAGGTRIRAYRRPL